MPTLIVLGRVRIRMFADDHHPPHFHIWTPDGEGVVLIDGLTLLRGSIRRHDLDIALAWAKDNTETLWEHWRTLNG